MTYSGMCQRANKTFKLSAEFGTDFTIAKSVGKETAILSKPKTGTQNLRWGQVPCYCYQYNFLCLAEEELHYVTEIEQVWIRKPLACSTISGNVGTWKEVRTRKLRSERDDTLDNHDQDQDWQDWLKPQQIEQTIKKTSRTKPREQTCRPFPKKSRRKLGENRAKKQRHRTMGHSCKPTNQENPLKGHYNVSLVSPNIL